MITYNRSQTPSLAEVIQTAIDANLINMHTCLPAKVVSYDASTQTASVMPSLTQAYENTNNPYSTTLTPVKYPVIPNVQVIWPRAAAGQAYMHMPLVADDDVTLFFCERSLDNWKQTGELSNPDDRRKFNITDAFAIPGGSAASKAFSVQNNEAVEFGNGKVLVQYLPDGTITIKNGGATVTVSPEGNVAIDAPMVAIGHGASQGVGLGNNIEDRLSALESALQTLTSVFGTAHTHAVLAFGTSGPPLPSASPFTAVPNPAASDTVTVSS